MFPSRCLRAAGDVVLPRTCVVCGCRLYVDERHICLGCQMDMPLTRYWERSHNPMADRFNEKIQERMMRGDGAGPVRGDKDGLRAESEGGGERYAYAAALFFYHKDAEYKRIPYHIKYKGDLSVGRFFGRMLGEKLSGSPLWSDVDVVIPVPLHWTRLWKRGYNQAEVIAGAVADVLDVPLRNDILRRRRRTRTQVKLGVEQKGKNVEGAFEVMEKAVREVSYGCSRVDSGDRLAKELKTGPVSFRHILLIDDVFTTGSTLEACHYALRKVFPPSVRISVATLGYLEG